MDIAEYIIELLQQHEVAVVPGLGSFHTSRMDGYYSKEQQQFYPPCLQAQFNAELKEGADLVDLISTKRQISQASARYFIEKFVATLKEQAKTNNVPLGKMGVFSTRRNELAFESNSLNESYELFYGLMPVKLKRSSAFKHEVYEAPVSQPKSPFFTKPRTEEAPKVTEPTPPPPIVEEPIVVTPEPEPPAQPIQHIHTAPEPTADLEVVEVEEEEKKGVNIWLILSIVIVFLGFGLIGLYRYKPELFNYIIPSLSQKKAPPVRPVNKVSLTDSLGNAIQAQHDTGTKAADTLAPKQLTPTSVPTTAAVDTFGVVVAALPTQKGAEQEAQRYIKMGFPQTEVRRKPNSKKLFFVNIGTYFIADSAQSNRLKLLKELDRPLNEISVQKYPYQKP